MAEDCAALFLRLGMSPDKSIAALRGFGANAAKAVGQKRSREAFRDLLSDTLFQLWKKDALCTFERRILDEAQLMEQQVQAHYVPVKRKAVDAFANNEEFQGAEGPARMKALLTRVQDSLQRDKRGSAVDWIPKRLANHDAIKFDDIAPKGLMSSHISCASHAPHACAGSLKIKNYCVLKVLPCHACMVTYAAFSPCCVCGPT